MSNLDVPSAARIRDRRRSKAAQALMWVVVAATVGACDGASTPEPASSVDATTASGGRKVSLSAARAVRYVKLVEVTEWNGKAWAAMAEFNLIDSTGAVVDRTRWKVSADSADVSDAPANAIDGNPKTHWHTRWQGTSPMPPHSFIVDLGMPIRVSGFRYLPRQDSTQNGSIAQYRFYVSTDGIDWGEPASAGDFSTTGAPADEKTVVFAEQTANHAPVATAPQAQSTPLGQAVSLRAVAEDADSDPLTFAAEGLPPGVVMFPTTGQMAGTPIAPGTYSVNISVKDNKGLASSAGFQWIVQAAVPEGNIGTPVPGEVRFIKLEQLSEAHGKPWGSIAEFNLIDASGNTLPRTGWTASADSSDVSDIPANAIDGSPGSIWHSQWDGASPPPPHSFIVDLHRFTKVRGVRYLPRQDKLTNGMLAKFRIYGSVDGVSWGKPLAEGDFSTMGPPNAEKTVSLK